MDTQDIVEAWRREAIQQGIQEGIQQGLVEVYEARFGPMPEDLRAAVEAIHDEPRLITWLRLVATRGADQIAAAIRSVRTR